MYYKRKSPIFKSNGLIKPNYKDILRNEELTKQDKKSE